MLRWFENRQVFAPMKMMVAEANDLGAPCEEVWLTASDQTRLHGWYYPSPADGPYADMVILLLHGNAGNISTRFHYYEAFRDIGIGVFAIDYRGFGKSEGQPTESGTYLDAQAAVRWLESQGIPETRLIAFGESLGGGIAAELAKREPLGGLVLQSTFTSIPDVGSEMFPFLPVRWLGSIAYNTRQKLPLIRIPVMIMHSRTDELIGFHHAENNFAAAQHPKLLWELSGGHNNVVEADREVFRRGMVRYLRLLRSPHQESAR